MVREINVTAEFERGQLEFRPIPKFTYAGTARTEIDSGRLSRGQVLEMFRLMLLIRKFEETVARVKSGQFKPIPNFVFVGATHLSVGQEAVAAGAVSAIGRHDYITSTHRGHGHSIAKGYVALSEMTDEELRAFVTGAPVREFRGAAGREKLLLQALDAHLYRTFAELFGKEDGYCRGRGGGMHVADFNVGHLGANAIVGGSSGIATGAAISVYLQGQDRDRGRGQGQDQGRLVACFLGDGAVNNGVCMESLNMACMAQFPRGIPVIYVVENNQYGMTGQAIGEVTGLDSLARRAAGFSPGNMNAEVVCGMDALAVWDAVNRAKESIRKGKGPVFLEAVTYRYFGHSLSDDGSKYRTEEEVAAWRRQDPVERLKRQLIEGEVTGEEWIARLEGDLEQTVRHAAASAAAAPDPDPGTICEGLWADTTSEHLDSSRRTVSYDVSKVRKFTRNKEGEILYRNAILEALTEEMIRDRRVVVFGEDVAQYGGAFQVTYGLYDIFGPTRVFNTAISEAAIVGCALGMSMTGLRPCTEIMYIDFVLQAMDQLGNQLAKTRYMFAGKARVPVVIRTTVGGGRGYAGQHSQSLEAVVAHFPGVRIAAPSTAYDAKGLLKTAIRDDNPVVFIEHQLLYTDRGRVPEEEYTLPFGQAAVRREGKDVTIIAYSYMATVAAQAADLLAAAGVDAEVVDPRTLVPLDVETIARSVRKTGRALILSQAPKTGCFGEHIAHEMQARALHDLKAPIAIAAAYEVPPPMAKTLEAEYVPGPDRVARAALDLIGKGGAPGESA